ncbi:MAG: molybdopterin dinucleotide binding domain-containing protein, partial [Acidimicrobiia bacterium]
RHLYDEFRVMNPGQPDYDEFVRRGFLHHGPDQPAERLVLLEAFRSDPDRHPLGTPSGRIELFSETVSGFGYEDCPGHPAWLEPAEWLGNAGPDYPLHLISNQPSARLHSQWDHGETSRHTKVAGREPVRLHPADAAARGIASGDVVRVFNPRGECLAGAVVDDAVRPGVIQLATGAWYTPAQPGEVGTPCLHGNPNVLTRDAGTSRLAQGPTAHTCLVEVARYEGEPPAIRPFDPPEFVRVGG